MIRNLLIILAALLAFVTTQGHSDDGSKKVHMATDLENVSILASQNKLPVLVFFAGLECEFCEALEEDHLGSMAHSNEYKDKVIIRKVFIDDYDDFRDFEGNKVSSEDFSDRFSIRVTPTIVLMDHKGQSLTKKILGYNRSDFFGVYLDEAISEAKNRIN